MTLKNRIIAVTPLVSLIIFLTVGYVFKLLFKYNGAKRKFRARINELTSAEYWEKVFNND